MNHFDTSHLYAVILAGGSGTRLWPLSTQKLPKQFLAVGGNDSFLQLTSQRLDGFIKNENRWVVCGKNHAEEVSRHLPNFSTSQILAEPCPRNTAAAIGLAAIHLKARDPDAVMVILAADHWIAAQDQTLFWKNLRTAAQLSVEKQALVTLGIPPSEASTAYGYLERGASVTLGESKSYRVKAFHEKPDSKTALEYFQNQNYFWNSGMFVWSAKVFLEELEKHIPATAQALERLSLKLNTPDYETTLLNTFETLENISVDYAIMEKSDRVFMVAAEFAWDDVGSLDSFEKLLSQNSDHNSIEGKVFSIDAKNNLVISQSKPIAILGIENLAVIEGKNAILVLPKQQAQDVKKIVEYLKQSGQKDLL